MLVQVFEKITACYSLSTLATFAETFFMVQRLYEQACWQPTSLVQTGKAYN